MAGTSGPSIEIGQSEQELVASKTKTNYKKIAYIVTGVVVVAAVIAVIVVFTTQGSDPPAEKALSLEELLNGAFIAKRNNATWISDTELMYKDAVGNLMKYNIESKAETLILSVENQALDESFTYELSADKQYLLITRHIQRLFRHSTVALYDAINLSTQQLYPISSNSTQDYLYLAAWSPVGSAIVFVQANNLYYKASATAAPVQITTDGSRDVQYGTCDWVYEEEIFSSKTATWFSPDGTKLAYIRFNDTRVHLMNIPVYGTPGTIESQYTQTIAIHYPKVGTTNPVVTLFSLDVTNLVAGQVTPTEMLAPVAVRNEDHVIAAVGWQNNQSFVSAWMNRIQNRAYIQTCAGSTCSEFKTFAPTTGWVNLYKTLKFSADGTQMVIIASQEQGTFGGYRHITLVSVASGTETVLTSGRFVVQDILKWDAASNFIFYTANTEENTHHHHIYAVKAQAGQISQCITCNINSDNQTHFTAEFSEHGHGLVLITEGPSIPRVDIYSWNVTADQVGLHHVTEYETNEALRSYLTESAVPEIHRLKIQLSSGFEATVKLQLPPNADLSGDTKYPMLVDVYAGPDSYNGNDRWDLTWGSYLASNKSVIYAHINGRGSGLRGDRLLHAIYYKFGVVEVEDQIEVARKLSIELPYIDSKRVAIWGWSYGGYASAMALAKDTTGVFQCAASVAPVTDWTYYDSIYTERFMGLPTETDNAAGYAASSVNTIPDSFRNKSLYLIHGTLDDNVHYQQSMALARSLETHDILFKQMSYPDEDHSLFSVRTHLYHSLGRYFAECFGLKDDL